MAESDQTAGPAGPVEDFSNKRLMALAALFDGEFTIDWMVELTGEKATYILQKLQVEVEQKRLRSPSPGIYCFPHRQKKRVDHDLLNTEGKNRLHGRIAGLLLRDLPESDDKPRIVAHHLLHIPNHMAGCRYLAQVEHPDFSSSLQVTAAPAALALDNAQTHGEMVRLQSRLNQEKRSQEEAGQDAPDFDEIVGAGPAIKKVLAQIHQVAATEATVLILGETGVGKELVARAIHRLSPRRDRPFIRVHCSALPENLIPSELLGHEKGAFSGATRRRIGRFELADTGTIFLDEIGDISEDIQIRLLRVLQTREFERVGGTETLRSDFRLVAATNRNLEQTVRSGRFRADLYYRLNVFPIVVPPLRGPGGAAELLDIHPSTLSFRMKKPGLKRGHPSGAS